MIIAERGMRVGGDERVALYIPITSMGIIEFTRQLQIASTKKQTFLGQSIDIEGVVDHDIQLTLSIYCSFRHNSHRMNFEPV